MSRKPNPQARDKILEAAHELIYKNGFKGVSMDDVAEAAHIKKANLFHYYPTKETLGLAVLDDAIKEMKEQMSAHFSNSQDPIETIQDMFTLACGEMEQQGCSGGSFLGNMALEMSDTNESFRQKVTDHIRLWNQRLADYLKQWQSQGYFGQNMNAEESAQMIVSLFEGAVLVSKATRSTDAIKNSAKLIHIILKKA